MMRIILCILFLQLFLACGKREFPDYKGDDNVYYEEAEGTYSGDFIVLNRSLRRFPANLLLWIKGNQFYVKIFLPYGTAKNRYQQFIHSGSRCPTKEDDSNQDGILDMSEVFSASGNILIPLDGVIQEQKRGNGWFPVANKKGSYYYSRSASVSKMMKDLYKKDKDSADGISKLKKGERLDLASRVIVIYGTSTNPLLPIACTYIKEKYL